MYCLRGPLVIVRVMGVDSQPWANNPVGIPDQIVKAVEAGFGLNLDDLDARTTEWEKEGTNVL